MVRGAVAVRSPAGRVTFANPKSRILRRPSGVTFKFPGLMSLCKIPAPCATANPSASCTPKRAISASGSLPSVMASEIVLPGTSSMTMKSMP